MQMDAEAKLCYIETESRCCRVVTLLLLAVDCHTNRVRHLYLRTILHRTSLLGSVPTIYFLLILSSNSFVIYFYFQKKIRSIFISFHLCLFSLLKTNILSHCFEYKQQQQQHRKARTQKLPRGLTTPSNCKSVRPL